jgi:hypothetical protein
LVQSQAKQHVYAFNDPIISYFWLMFRRALTYVG